jgi:subtilase family serine protease
MSLPGLTSTRAIASSPSPKTMAGTVPEVVSHGHAQANALHDPSAPVHLAIVLPLRNQSGLDAFLAQANDPQSPQYHHYLSQATANQDYNPTDSQQQQVVAWLSAHGFTVTGTYPNHLLVDATGTTQQAEQLFGVQINDYSGPAHGKTVHFYAPSSNPVIDASVADDVAGVAGLDSYPRVQMATNGTANGSTPYFPQDFANAYDVNPLWNAGDTGSGQRIGITLWTVPPSDTTLQHWATKTGASVATAANGRLHVIKVDTGTTTSDSGEAGMDIEESGGMAPGAQIDYYEAPTDSSGNPTGQGLLDVLDTAGTSTNNDQQISSSWGGCEDSTLDAWETDETAIFKANAATGHDYLFSTGDSGSSCNTGTVQDPYPDDPATNPYVTAVGGTRFTSTIKTTDPGEAAWAYCGSCGPEGSGGGYSNIFSRPSWQTGSGLASNGMRGYPDVSAVADPNTGAYVCYGASSSCGQFGGTSLSTPLWAGMLALLNEDMAALCQSCPLQPGDHVPGLRPFPRHHERD